MTFFIEGNPASRIFDKTDVGTIIEGSPDIELAEWSGGLLTVEQAKWLYDYMAKQDEIPFEYANDGCFARAHRMADYMDSLGIPVQKTWVGTMNRAPELFLPIDNYASGAAGVNWWYHVAPVIPVDTGTACTLMVIDPSVGLGGPVTISDWEQSFRGSATSSNLWREVTPADVYSPPYRTTATDPRLRASDQRVKTDLNRYRLAREILLGTSFPTPHY